MLKRRGVEKEDLDRGTLGRAENTDAIGGRRRGKTGTREGEIIHDTEQKASIKKKLRLYCIPSSSSLQPNKSPTISSSNLLSLSAEDEQALFIPIPMPAPSPSTSSTFTRFTFPLPLSSSTSGSRTLFLFSFFFFSSLGLGARGVWSSD